MRPRFLVGKGEYNGYEYRVLEDKEGKRMIFFSSWDIFKAFRDQGAPVALLDNIGPQDPIEVLEAFFASIPENE